MDHLNLNMRRYKWIGLVKDYTSEILYHSGKTNVVIDDFSRNVATDLIRDLCLRMTIILPLLDLIKEDQVERIRKENWKKEQIRGLVANFTINNWGLLTQCGRV